MWAQLPELVLTQVFSQLGPVDRANCAEVCRHWALCLSIPGLWRRCVVRIDRDLGSDYSVISEQAVKYGEHMRSLELVWTRPYTGTRREPRITRSTQAEAGANFLALVQTKDVKLREVILTNWVHSSKWGNCDKLLYSLANLLATQQYIEKFSLANANLGLADALRLLAIVTKFSSGHLRFLNLCGAFRELHAPRDNPRYLRLLGRMTGLTHLSLDYSALSVGTLTALVVGAPNNLTTLHVLICDSDSRQHRIEDAAWSQLVEACPRLTVSYTIINLSHYEDVRHLLMPSVPLAKFQIFGGHQWDQSRTRNFRATLALLITHYTKTLAEVMLQVRNNREMLDDLILSMLLQCKHLQKLQYDGILRNMETFREICEFLAKHETAFDKVHLKTRNINDHNLAVLRDINDEYDRQLDIKGIDMHIDN
ncbi:F-box only protein 39-like [Trichogramma pretiosum]|uniref:F-box only protein 39-like n=1 Tax=Trichogramma pretiosum TaxID=7493 RepID=UPI0006C95397|nr:F-box only protein 39-like [Trichogramma pretiosum]